ncbi:MAG: hypothetical protein KDA52_25035, partial [Planctomycetaceae bacterium]|nr:hypothetical protein [Planctomycetaceae bacterium]
MWAKHTRLCTIVALPAILTASTFIPPAAMGQRTTQTSQAKVAVPANGQLLELTVQAPQEVKVGETYQMVATLVNRSNSIDLHDIRLESQTSGSVEIQSSRIERSQNDQQQHNQQSQQTRSGEDAWTIQKLAAGESARLILQAVGDEQQEAECCLAVKSFRIASKSEPLCTATRFVKPDLQITKQAPERATLCDV